MKRKNRDKRITDSLQDKLTGLFVHLGYKERRQLIAVCILSVVVRIIYLLHLKASIFFENHVLDSAVIDLWAKDIVAGNFWGNTAFFRAPLYIYIVAFIYQLVGTSHLAIILFQNALGLITIVIAYLYCLHLFNYKVAFLAGIILSFWPTLVFFEGELMITSLSVFFALVSVFLLHRAIESKKPANFFVAGIVLGLSAITNPTLLPIFLIIPFYHIITKDKPNHIRMLKLAAIYLLGLVIPIIPVTVRNAVVAHDFVFISTQGGANFYIGNGKRADGISVEALGPVTRSRLYYEDNIWTSSVGMAEYELGRKLKDSEVSSYWFKKALEEMVENPGRMLGLFIKKYYYFWHGQEIFNIKSVYFSCTYSWLMRFLLWKNFLNFPSGILFPLMFVGIFYAIKNKQRTTVPLLFLLIYSVTIMLFFVCSRFRQPVIPVAVLFSAYGIHHSVQMIRQKKDKMVLIGGSIFVTFLILLNLGGNNESPLNLSQSKAILGSLYLERKDYKKAAENFEASLAILPDNMQMFSALGASYIKMGRYHDAERTFKKGLEIYPQFSGFNFDLSRLYLMEKRFDEAKPFLLTAIKNDPEFAAPYFLLGSIYEQEGNTDSARYIYERLLQHDPNNSKARQSLSRLKSE